MQHSTQRSVRTLSVSSSSTQILLAATASHLLHSFLQHICSTSSPLCSVLV